VDNIGLLQPFIDGKNPVRDIADYVGLLNADKQRAEDERRARIMDALAESWPAQLAKETYRAVTLPGEVYAGRVDPMSDEAVKRSFDLAGLLTLGAGAVPAGKNEMRMGIKAYHGSPHDFDRFDMSKIGTGEGAQAYGHGLYFAGNEKVAKGYRDALSPSTIDGVPVKGMTKPLSQSDDDILRAVISMEKSTQDARWRLDRMNRLDLMEKLDEMVASGRIGKAGRMYEVNLNTTPDRLLDWDKPLSGQPQAVRDALLKAAQGAPDPKSGPAQRNRAAILAGDGSVPGDILYNNLGGFRDPADAARRFREAGVDGIKYLDAGSRPPIYGPYVNDLLSQFGSKEKALEIAKQRLANAKDSRTRIMAEEAVSVLSIPETRNYVMFDDKLVQILRKYGVATAAALPAAALAELGLTRKEAESLM
jgi:hypothetical protein